MGGIIGWRAPLVAAATTPYGGWLVRGRPRGRAGSCWGGGRGTIPQLARLNAKGSVVMALALLQLPAADTGGTAMVL
jgi:hypothetical protein